MVDFPFSVRERTCWLFNGRSETNASSRAWILYRNNYPWPIALPIKRRCSATEDLRSPCVYFRRGRESEKRHVSMSILDANPRNISRLKRFADPLQFLISLIWWSVKRKRASLRRGLDFDKRTKILEDFNGLTQFAVRSSLCRIRCE